MMNWQKSRMGTIRRPKGIVPVLLILVWLCLTGSSHGQNQYDPKQAENAFVAGQRLYQEGKYKLAADTLERAVVIFEQLKNVTGHVQSMNLRAECLSNLGQCDEAGTLLRHSLGLAIPALGEDHVEVAQTYYYLSRFAGGCARKFDEAFAFMSKSTAIKLKLYGKEDPAIAFDYTFLGYMLNSKGEFDSALHYLTHALEIRLRTLPEDDVETSNTMYNLAISYDGISDLAKALDLHLKSLRIREEKLGPLHPSVSNSINHLGRLYRRFGNLDRALDYYQKALEIRKASLGNEHPNVGSSYYEIGNLYGTISNYHNAIQYLQQGHRIMENNVQSSDDILSTYYAYTGKMYGLLGDHHSAVGYLHKAISLGEKIMKPDHPYLAVIYNLAGEYYVDQNDQKNQSLFFQKAIGIYRKVYGNGSEREADVISKMGTSSSANNFFSEAEQYFQKALAIYVSKLGSQNPKVSGIHLSIGDLFSKRGQYADALMAYRHAFEAISSAPTKDIYANPNLDQLESKPLAFKIAQSKALMLVEYAEAKNNDLSILKSAFSASQFAITLADEIQGGYSHEKARADLEKENRGVYNIAMALAWRLLSLTGDEQYMKEAFRVSGKSKSTLLLENTRDLRAKTLAGVPDSLVNEERDMKTVLTYYNDKLSHARKQKDTAQAKLFENGLFETQGRLDKLKKGLETAFPSYYNLKYAAGDIDIEKIQALLSRRSGLLVEYFVTDTSIYKFIVSAKEFDLECLRKDSISQLIKDYERSITDASFIINNRGEADRLYTRTSHELYRKLLSLEHYEDDRLRNLVIIPDDILATLSFSTLLREPFNGQTPDYGSLPYLLKRWAISFAYSSIFISDSQSNTSRLGLPFAGFAPAYFGQQFANVDTTLHPMAHVVARSGNLPLPGAQDEVRSIAEFMNGESWLAQEATESAFKQHAPNYNILHLAMHSLLNNEDPQFSELLFSPMSDPVDDGFLTVSEIYNIRLNAQLVVLSACSSGYGKIQSGEGPISISRAFSYAGCPSILMSLWKIPDAGTADIMKNFYAELKDGKTKDEALRLAQLKFLGETTDPMFRHPYFWAGFVVMGDTGPLQSSLPVILYYFSGLFILAIVIFAFLKRRLGFSSTGRANEPLAHA